MTPEEEAAKWILVMHTLFELEATMVDGPRSPEPSYEERLRDVMEAPDLADLRALGYGDKPPSPAEQARRAAIWEAAKDPDRVAAARAVDEACRERLLVWLEARGRRPWGHRGPRRA
jgi:hypothetical protein